MCHPAQDSPAYSADFRAGLEAEGWLLPLGVAGVYGRSGDFERIVSGLQHLITLEGAGKAAQVVRFPAVLPTAHYLKTDHLETMPDLIGHVQGFDGDDRALRRMLADRDSDQDWTGHLSPSGLTLVPAACYPLYPTLTSPLPESGRLFDLETPVFRNEPSLDPGRMQCFRQREYVFAGAPEAALAHRDEWLERSSRLLESLGLAVRVALANDPFFGRGGKVLKSSQREQAMKYEILAPVGLNDADTAISSSNFHADHFGRAFDLHDAGGRPISTACVGFGLERITLALLRQHGLRLSQWPDSVLTRLALA